MQYFFGFLYKRHHVNISCDIGGNIYLFSVFISILGDGSVGLTEFRVDCVNRMAYKTIGELDAAYEKLLNVSFYE